MPKKNLISTFLPFLILISLIGGGFPITEYQIYHTEKTDSLGSYSGNATAEAVANQISFPLDSKAVTKQPHYYVVTAVNSGSERPYSNELIAHNALQKLHVSVQAIYADNDNISITFVVEDNDEREVDNVQMSISNGIYVWTGNTSENGQLSVGLDYTKDQFVLEVNATKSGYNPDQVLVRIDLPALGFDEPAEFKIAILLAIIVLVCLVMVGPWLVIWRRSTKVNLKARIQLKQE